MKCPFSECQSRSTTLFPTFICAIFSDCHDVGTCGVKCSTLFRPSGSSPSMPWIAAERNADEDHVCSGTDSRCGVKKLPDITSCIWPSESAESQGTRLCHKAFAASDR